MSALHNPHGDGFDNDVLVPYLDASQSDVVAMPSNFDMNQRPPFRDPMEGVGVQPYGVLRIKNVPFAVSIPEIKSFVSHLTKSPLIKEHIMGYPVHIIMERPTGKTLDTFVELRYAGGAQAALDQAERLINEGKVLKIGTRHVDLELSSEGDLCAALFPRAKSVHWNPDTGVPLITSNQDPYSDGFQGFFTVEEITTVCKHALNPYKSIFSQRCQQRVYESMISTLYKFPWGAPQHYSVNARNFLWSTYMDMLNVLLARVSPSNNRSLYGELSREVGLSHALLMDFIFTGLNVPMFSLRQKSIIVHMVGELGPGFDLPVQATRWPFQALVPAKPCDPEIMDGWLRVLNIGYEKIMRERIRHGYEEHLTINRDENGFPKVDLSAAGRALTFRRLISIELGFMEFVIETARIGWFRKCGVPFEPLSLWGVPSHAVHGVELESSMKLLTLTRSTSEPSIARKSFSALAFDTPTSNTPDDDEEHAIKAVDNKAFDNGPRVHSFAATQFNPATPPFIPSQPWSVTHYDAVTPEPELFNTIPQSQTDRRDRSSSAFTALPPSPDRLLGRQAGAYSLFGSESSHSNVLGGDRSTSDPSRSRSSPHIRRAPSTPVGRLPNSGFRDGLNQSSRPATMTRLIASDEDGVSGFQELPPSAFPQQPAFDTTWSSPHAQSSPFSTVVNATPTRRSVSSETGSANTSPLRNIRSKSLSSPFVPFRAPSPDPYEGFPTMQGRLEGLADKQPPAWASTSDIYVPKRHGHAGPNKGSVSRSAFQPQATIDEEGDMYAAQPVDGGALIKEEN